MKRFFKSIKKKWKAVFGTVSTALLIGGASAYWVAEKKGFEENITKLSIDLGSSIFIGDTGESSNERDAVLKMVEQGGRVDNIFLLGDLGYPNGTKNQDEFNEWIKPFLSLAEKVHCILGNHDSIARNKEERAWLALNADKNGCIFGNYYRGISYSDWCVGIIDSAIYDTLKEIGMQERQENFIKKFFTSNYCTNKKTMLLNHHTVYTYGSHMRDGNKDHNNFVKSLEADFVISGHDHLLALTKVGKTTYIVSGAGAKLDECKKKEDENCWEKNGYFIYDQGKFKRIEL